MTQAGHTQLVQKGICPPKGEVAGLRARLLRTQAAFHYGFGLYPSFSHGTEKGILSLLSEWH